MLPSYPRPNAIDNMDAHAILFGEVFIVFVPACPDGENLFRCEFGSGVAISSGKDSFSRGVLGILCNGAEKEMGYLNTERHIALVADEEPSRDGSMDILPRGTVSPDGLPLEFDLSIAVRAYASRPDTASRRVWAAVSSQAECERTLVSGEYPAIPWLSHYRPPETVPVRADGCGMNAAVGSLYSRAMAA